MTKAEADRRAWERSSSKTLMASRAVAFSFLAVATWPGKRLQKTMERSTIFNG